MSWPISSRKLFEPMSIAASWPGQRASSSASAERFEVHRRRLCGSARDAAAASGAFLECSPLRPLPGPDMLRTDLDPLPRLRVEPQAPGSGFARGGAAGRGDARSRPTAAGLEAGAVTIESNGFAMPAYRAMPAGGERPADRPRRLRDLRRARAHRRRRAALRQARLPGDRARAVRAPGRRQGDRPTSTRCSRPSSPRCPTRR